MLEQPLPTRLESIVILFAHVLTFVSHAARQSAPFDAHHVVHVLAVPGAVVVLTTASHIEPELVHTSNTSDSSLVQKAAAAGPTVYQARLNDRVFFTFAHNNNLTSLDIILNAPYLIRTPSTHGLFDFHFSSKMYFKVINPHYVGSLTIPRASIKWV